jgi:hypothetical protein
MRIRNQGTLWAIFLLLAGLFLLLKNLAMFDPWGDAIWGGLFAVTGLVFLGAFIIDPRQWWRSIPGFILISIGALILLQWQKINLGDWRASLVLFGIALGFWSVLLAHNENWWAAIPAGVLTELGVLRGLEHRLDATTWLAAFLGGLGLVFALMYLLRERDTRWAAIPAVALILVAITTLATTVAANLQVVIRFWPILLMVGALGLLMGALQRTPATTSPEPALPKPASPTIKAAPAKGKGMAPKGPQPKPPAGQEPPLVSVSGAPDEEKPIDIYELLKQQPAETAPESPPPPNPAPDEPGQ